MLKTREVVWENDRVIVTLVVKEASTYVGIRRARLMSDVQNLASWKDEKMSIEERVVRQITYTACAAALVSANVAPKDGITLDDSEKITTEISVEEFLNLPESLVVRWNDAVLAVNPHWQSSKSDEGDSRKNVSVAGESSVK